jgi:hypothetical protein
MNAHSPEYIEYRKSPGWKITRAYMIKRVGGGCQQCHSSTRLQVHHRTYERLGRELPEDLLVLCEFCHKIEDRRRKDEIAAEIAHNSEMAEIAYENARLHGWASKKYGEDWADYMDTEQVQEEFDNWLERREDRYGASEDY